MKQLLLLLPHVWKQTSCPTAPDSADIFWLLQSEMHAGQSNGQNVALLCKNVLVSTCPLSNPPRFGMEISHTLRKEDITLLDSKILVWWLHINLQRRFGNRTLQDVESINLYAPCVLYTGTGVSLLFIERFFIFNQQIYFIIWYLLDRASLI